MPFFIALLLGLAEPARPAWATSSVTFLQATVVAPDAAGRTLSFVDASGRSRSHTVAGAAADRVGRLRPGDEVIVVLSGTEAVVQDVRRSQATAPAPSAPPTESTAPATSAGPAADGAGSGTDGTMASAPRTRPSWPNPYSRYYRGPRPAPKPDPRR